MESKIHLLLMLQFTEDFHLFQISGREINLFKGRKKEVQLQGIIVLQKEIFPISWEQFIFL